MAKSRVSKIRLRPRATPSDAPSAPRTTQAPPNNVTRHAADTGRLRASDPEFWTLINEIADPTPIATAELDAIERYFSAVLDDVFATSRKKSP